MREKTTKSAECDEFCDTCQCATPISTNSGAIFDWPCDEIDDELLRFTYDHLEGRSRLYARMFSDVVDFILNRTDATSDRDVALDRLEDLRDSMLTIIASD